MNELAKSISRLYEPDVAPVIAVSGRIILFFNAAAVTVFPSLEVNKPAAKILPSSFLSCKEDVFAATAQVSKQSVYANGVWYNGILLLRIYPVPKAFSFSPEYMILTLRLQLTSMRLALEQLQGADDASLSVLWHTYHNILRCCQNTDLAYRLSTNDCVYRPALLDIILWMKDFVKNVNETTQKSGVTVTLDFDIDVPSINADVALLEHMLLNLISNSLQNSGPGDKIHICLSTAEHYVTLEIRDNGKGFDKSYLGRMFSRQFGNTFQSLGESRGLGLYIAWGIVTMHNGTMTAANRKDKGAVITISLPCRSSSYLTLRSDQVEYITKNTQKLRILTGLANALPREAYSKSEPAPASQSDQ